MPFPWRVLNWEINVIKSLLTNFNALAINDRIDPFFEDDIDLYLNEPAEFALQLKRSSTDLAIYGQGHVDIRQQFFNHLPSQIRIQKIKEKLSQAGLVSWIETSMGKSLNQIHDVLDIGKGRSVYKLVLGQTVVVIKEKSNVNQSLYNQKINALGYDGYQCWFNTIKGVHWELSEFLGDQSVFQLKKDALIQIYARAAAIGDYLGVGDRHFENYFLKDTNLIDIDVTHFMEVDNDQWTKRYIKGGLYEVCLLQQHMSSLQILQCYGGLFFQEYLKSATGFFDSKLNQHLGKWTSWESVIQHLDSNYLPAITAMFNRLVYKKVLAQLVASQVSLEKYPELKMYYLADKNRISTFFRMHELSVDIFDQIQQLALDHLGISKQYFVDHKKYVMDLEGIILNAFKLAVIPTKTSV